MQRFNQGDEVVVFYATPIGDPNRPIYATIGGYFGMDGSGVWLGPYEKHHVTFIPADNIGMMTSDPTTLAALKK